MGVAVGEDTGLAAIERSEIPLLGVAGGLHQSSNANQGRRRE
jgi:hypothetical protein